MFEIKSITGRIHDTSYGGYPFKITVVVNIDSKSYNKLKVIRKATSGMFGYSPAKRDLGPLVLDVNNELYKINQDIPAHNPSIDSKGSRRAINGVKTMVFEYFFNECERAKKLGFTFISNTEVPKYNQVITIL